MDEIERQKMLRAQEAEPERIIISRAGLPCQNCATLTTERDRYRERVEDHVLWIAAHWPQIEQALQRMVQDEGGYAVAHAVAAMSADTARMMDYSRRALAGTGETP